MARRKKKAFWTLIVLLLAFSVLACLLFLAFRDENPPDDDEPQPLRTLEEIRADILALEKETEGLLDELLKGEGA